MRNPSLLALCWIALSACQSDRPAPQPTPAAPAPGVTEASAPRPMLSEPEPLAWTDAFAQKAVLLAETIEIEGPPGLRVHAALTADTDRYVVSQKATDEGLLQTVATRPEQGFEVRCQLDAWQLAAQHIRVLERPGNCDVVVRATGAPVWVDPVRGRKEDPRELVFVGKLP
ncbi:MAG: hypothetical protein R3F17_10135 [Planctomycetota bacterium]